MGITLQLEAYAVENITNHSTHNPNPQHCYDYFLLDGYSVMKVFDYINRAMAKQ
jgi:hypothetical protein